MGGTGDTGQRAVLVMHNGDWVSSPASRLLHLPGKE